MVLYVNPAPCFFLRHSFPSLAYTPLSILLIMGSQVASSSFVLQTKAWWPSRGPVQSSLGVISREWSFWIIDMCVSFLSKHRGTAASPGRLPRHWRAFLCGPSTSLSTGYETPTLENLPWEYVKNQKELQDSEVLESRSQRNSLQPTDASSVNRVMKWFPQSHSVWLRNCPST